jgi:Na+-translocating ferredoxin:NAD+ oxidoreductase RnfD subunit
MRCLLGRLPVGHPTGPNVGGGQEMSVTPPFLRIGKRSSSMATWTLFALMVPSVIYSFLYHSPFVLHVVGYALLGMAAEGIYALFIHREVRFNGISSGLTAALIAASVPPDMPFPPMLYSILIAVWIVKLPNRKRALRLNAAMTGRLFLMLAYNNDIVAWGAPVDGLSTATPQELYQVEGFPLDWHTLLFGRIDGIWEDLFQLVPGSPGETFPIVLLLLGAILCWKSVLTWRTPVAFLVSFSIATAVFGNSPLFNLLSSATIFSAVFIVSDPVSTPISKGGKIACGIIIGVGNAAIRNYTYYTEAIVYAILLGNLCTPLLDRIAFTLQGRRLARRKVAP